MDTRKRELLQGYIADVKLGVSRFPAELGYQPRAWAQGLGPLVFEGVHGHGGHFAAWEAPDLLAEDLRRMFEREGGAYKCVNGCSGYDDE